VQLPAPLEPVQARARVEAAVLALEREPVAVPA